MAKRKFTMGDRVRHARLERGISGRELSRRCGVSENLIGQIERDEHDIMSATLYELSVQLGVSMNFLFSGKNHGNAIAQTNEH